MLLQYKDEECGEGLASGCSAHMLWLKGCQQYIVMVLIGRVPS